MKGLILTGLLFTQVALGAQFEKKVNCRAEVLSSYCGSGEIILNLDFEENTFRYRHGDVDENGMRCEQSDFRVEGIFTEVERNRNFFSTKSYFLTAETGRTLKLYLDKNYYRNPTFLARIETNLSAPENSVRDGVYNLVCREYE